MLFEKGAVPEGMQLLILVADYLTVKVRGYAALLCLQGSVAWHVFRSCGVNFPDGR
jgi:hypothetical protein